MYSGRRKAMSDLMYTIPFPKLVERINSEWKDNGSIFACTKVFCAGDRKKEPFMGRMLETPVGPAAGPHTQLAQNIVAAYVCGGRFFELKTVQKLDGEDLEISKPCIIAEDEAYNCEWSTELTVPQAFEEYVKAWILLHYLAAEYGMGSRDGFVFNMSVGYDLEGIMSPKMDSFIEGMKDASDTEIFKDCIAYLKGMLPEMKNMTEADIDAISPNIAGNVTMSTMHGCPAGEIERIAMYLLEEKGLDLYLKCNPTLMGYDYVRQTLDELGFDYIKFTHEAFDFDLGFDDAVPMLKRLKAKAEELGRWFGVKLTNTFPVQQLRGELPDETIYMSGRTLLPLSLKVAQRITEAFDGKLDISYCGGVGAQNIKEIYSAGLFPITICTDLLKPGGYHRLNSSVLALMDEDAYCPEKPDASLLGELARTLCGMAKHSRGFRRKDIKTEEISFSKCKNVCAACVTLCPNRANVVILAGEHRHMLHMDGPCNECGNCASFCPEKTVPYLEKSTLFVNEKALRESSNTGFAPIDEERRRFLVRYNGQLSEYEAGTQSADIPEDLVSVIDAVADHYKYLMY